MEKPNLTEAELLGLRKCLAAASFGSVPGRVSAETWIQLRQRGGLIHSPDPKQPAALRLTDAGYDALGASHAADGDRCWCGVHHYHCASCGEDCTVGKPAGPATTDTAGVTRCRECYASWAKEVSAITPTNRAEVKAIAVALGQLCGERSEGGAPPITQADRDAAFAILCRYDDRGLAEIMALHRSEV